MKINTPKRSHFQTKLFTRISLSLTLLSLIVSIIFSIISIKHTIDSDKTANQILLDRVTTQIDGLYEQMNVAATSLTKNPALKQILLELNTLDSAQSREYIAQLQQERTISGLLGNMMFSPGISSVLLYNQQKGYFYYTGTYLSNPDYTQNRLSQPSDTELLRQGLPLYLPPATSPWSDSEWTVISVLKSFSDSPTTQDTIVEIQIPAWQIDAICDEKSLPDGKEILILDSRDNLVYPYTDDSRTLAKKENEEVLNALADKKTSMYRLSHSYLSSVSKDTGYTTVLVSNNKFVRQQIFVSFISSFLGILIILAVMLIIVYNILTMFTNPLKQLITYVGQISLDDETKLKLPSSSLDEFEMLNMSMTQMVTNLKKSAQEIYELQLRESNANLAALQAQIDPHFMYNALNSISAASEIYGSEMTTKMCQQFSSMMRYVTSGRQTVPLMDELKHTENYLEFMSLSNEENFSYTLDCDASLDHLLVPKLSIQPLVENCFKHGFGQTPPPWSIKICCMTSAPHHWEIIIEDNGTGFSPEALHRIDSLPLSFHALEINGLGLNNTFSRFSIQFQKDFSYEITNLSPGSRITLKGILRE